MSSQMIIRIDDDMKNQLAKLSQAEGKNTSQVVRELIEAYIRERDIGSYVEDLWMRIGKRLKARRVSPVKIRKAILDTRADKK
jgi:predicted DNA-binding protein